MTKLMKCDNCKGEYMRSDSPARNKHKSKFCSNQCKIEGMKPMRGWTIKKKDNIRGLIEFMGWK